MPGPRPWSLRLIEIVESSYPDATQVGRLLQETTSMVPHEYALAHVESHRRRMALRRHDIVPPRKHANDLMVLLPKARVSVVRNAISQLVRRGRIEYVDAAREYVRWVPRQ